SLGELLAFTEAARDLGYTHLCANDHLVFSRAWLDGPTALAAVLAHSGQMSLATTVAVPVLRGPAATAKILAAIDLLSGGRLLVGLGPGSSARDYELVGVPFEERWKRLDEAVETLRAYWRADDVAFEGAFYSTAGFTLAPTPAQRPAPPIWIERAVRSQERATELPLWAGVVGRCLVEKRVTAVHASADAAGLYDSHRPS